MVAMLAQNRLQDAKMDRAHIRRQDCIACVEHFLRKFSRMVLNRLHIRMISLLLPQLGCCKQAADTDSGCTQIVDFINLQQGVHAVGVFQDFCDLVTRYRIQTAAEGIELDQLQILS